MRVRRERVVLVLPEGVYLQKGGGDEAAQQSRRHEGLRPELPREGARDEQRRRRLRHRLRLAGDEAGAVAVEEERRRHVVQTEGVVRREDQRAVPPPRVGDHVVHVDDFGRTEDDDLLQPAAAVGARRHQPREVGEALVGVVPVRQAELHVPEVLLPERLEHVRDPLLAIRETRRVGLTLAARGVAVGALPRTRRVRPREGRRRVAGVGVP